MRRKLIIYCYFFPDYGDVSGLPDPFSGEVVDSSGGQRWARSNGKNILGVGSSHCYGGSFFLCVC